MAYAVVNTDLSMNNTVEAVCSDLGLLLRALSDAMARVNDCRCMQFVTNVTFFDGEACAADVCPQCQGRRRLLSNAVSLATVSTSVEPVPIAAIQQQTVQPAALIQSELAASLAVVAPNLVSAGVNPKVYSIPVVSQTPVFLKNNDAGLIRGVMAFVVVIVSFLSAVCVTVSRRQRLVVRRNLTAQVRPLWMPTIRMKQTRSGGADGGDV
jgi:hypothetical protein